MEALRVGRVNPKPWRVSDRDIVQGGAGLLQPVANLVADSAFNRCSAAEISVERAVRSSANNGDRRARDPTGHSHVPRAPTDEEA